MSWPVERRTRAIDEIANSLPQRSGQLSRILWRHARGQTHRGMASVLVTLGEGPETVGRLAEIEGVAQPTMTRMVGRLEAEGLVERRRGAPDGRLVVVGLTVAGEAELTSLRVRYRTVLRELLEAAPDEQLEELLRAADALGLLVQTLRQPE
jgi:DNA-binding MarR family transcriptional regulator